MKIRPPGCESGIGNRDYLARFKIIATVPTDAVTTASIAKREPGRFLDPVRWIFSRHSKKKTTDAREETMYANLTANADSIGHANLQNANAYSRLSASDRMMGASRALALLEVSERSDDWKRAHAVASRLIDHCTEGQLLPSLIARFLEQHWKRHLAQLYVNKDTRNQVWRDALEATATLIWSVQPQNNEANRKQFFARLPKLYQRLHEGLEMIGAAAQEKEEFFAELSRLHVESLHPSQDTNEAQQPNISRDHTSHAEPGEHHQKEAVKEEVKSLDPRKGTNEAQQPNESREHTSLAESGEHHRDQAVKEKVESLHPRKGTNEARQPNESREHTSLAKAGEHHRDRAVKDEAEKPDRAQNSDACDSQPEAGRESIATVATVSDILPNLRIGSRVEFCGARKRKQLMSLKWISRNKEVFLFKDHCTDHELCLTSARLNQHLSERAAVAVD